MSVVILMSRGDIMTEMSLIGYEHWRYICNEIGVFGLQPGQDWPILPGSPIIKKVTDISGGVEMVSHLLSESVMDIFQRLRCKRNSKFLELASDVNIHVSSLEKYLDRNGQYTLIHTNQDVVDWVNKKYIGSSSKVKAFHVSEFAETLSDDQEELIASFDCVFDSETFVIDMENVDCTIKSNFRRICNAASDSGASVYSLVPLVEYMPPEASGRADWTEGELEPFGSDIIFSTLPINECKRVLFDDGRFKNYLQKIGVMVSEVSPPMKSLEWSSNQASYCARVLY